MIGYSAENGTVIGVEFIPRRVKPCLVIQKGNVLTKVASFNDWYSASIFMDAFADAIRAERIDWINDESLPIGARLARGWDWPELV